MGRPQALGAGIPQETFNLRKSTVSALREPSLRGQTQPRPQGVHNLTEKTTYKNVKHSKTLGERNFKGVQ